MATSAAFAAAAGLVVVLLFAAQATPLVAVTESAAIHSIVASREPHGPRPGVAVAMHFKQSAFVAHVRPASTACPKAVALRRPAVLAKLNPVQASEERQVAHAQEYATLVISDATTAAPSDPVKDELAALASAPGEEERLAAVSALARRTSEVRVREGLLRALTDIHDESVRLNIVAALAPYADRPEVLQVFGKILREGDDEPVSLNIISAIAPAASRETAMESLAEVMNSTQDEAVGLNALAAVAPFAGHMAVQRALIGLMRNGRSEALRLNAVAALAPHANISTVHRAFVDTLDLDIASAERANIKAALGISPAATEVATNDSTWLTPEETAAKAASPGKEMLIGDVSATGTVRIDNVHGNIEVVGWSRASGQVEATVQGDPNAVRVYGTFEHGDLRVSSTQLNDKVDVSVDYIVHVPAGAHIIVNTVSGNILVHGVTGAVDATSTQGDVEVNGAHGPVSATSTSGDVIASGLRGDSTLKSVSGDVQVEYDELDGSQAVHAESTAGEVTIVMPANTSAHITAQTVSGAIHSCDGDNVDEGGAGAKVDKTTGKGSARVDLRAISGDITITSH